MGNGGRDGSRAVPIPLPHFPFPPFNLLSTISLHRSSALIHARIQVLARLHMKATGRSRSERVVPNEERISDGVGVMRVEDRIEAKESRLPRAHTAPSAAPSGRAGALSGMPSWDAVYTEWHLPLLRYVHRLTRDPHLAEDITHEAFLRLLRESREIRNPSAWLFQVCTNMVRDNARRFATEQRSDPIVETSSPEPPDVEFDRAEAVREVRLALDRLTPRDREALLLRESGFRYAEIAEILGVRAEIVPTLIARALRRFQKSYQLGKRHDTPE
jgi:RNA polymerase sigma-70 factor, ECF subfamily